MKQMRGLKKAKSEKIDKKLLKKYYAEHPHESLPEFADKAATEHNAQMMLCTLLMSKRYSQHIGHGLLYYLHTNQTQEITVCRSGLVGLIMRRNELAKIFSRPL